MRGIAYSTASIFLDIPCANLHNASLATRIIRQNVFEWLSHAVSLITTGFVTGVIVGLTGVGGGSLMTPALVLLFGIAPAVAVGTDLLFAAATKSVGTAVHREQGNIDWSIVAHLSGGSVPAALLTVGALHWFKPDVAALAAAIKFALGLALLLTAAAILLRGRLARLAQRFQFSGSRQARLTVLTGLALGVLVTLSSVGAGAIGVAALMLLYPERPAAQIAGTDVAHAVPLTLIAGLGHAGLGHVDYTLLAALLIGSIPGIAIGSMLARRVPERLLKGALAGMLTLAGAKLISL